MWFMYKFQKLMLEGIDYIMNILLVCTGNTCRSSMAKGLLEQILDEEGDRSIEVDSAGLNVYVPSEASEYAVEVMDEMGGLIFPATVLGSLPKKILKRQIWCW